MDKLYGEIDKKISDDCIEFNKNIESNMRYRNEISSDLLNLEWLDLLENACPDRIPWLFDTIHYLLLLRRWLLQLGLLRPQIQ